TLTAAEMAVFPAASRATAVRVCTPLLAVMLFHERVYGAVVTSAPRFVPSSLNCTPATPTLRVAIADTALVPGTEAPATGAVMETAGGVVSGTRLLTVTLTAAEVAALPAASLAAAVTLWLPFALKVVFQDIEYGAVVTSAPRFTPSSLNCTPTTPTSSVAFAETVIVPETEAPAAGAVMDTLGGVVSFATVTVGPVPTSWTV